MDDDKSSLIHNSIVGNFFHSEVDIPGTEGKLDCGWIAFGFFARDSKSEIYEARIMRRRLICRNTHCEIKIHFACVLCNVTGVGSNPSCILFEEVGRLLKRPGK